jgi:hypothetical protein
VAIDAEGLFASPLLGVENAWLVYNAEPQQKQ